MYRTMSSKSVNVDSALARARNASWDAPLHLAMTNKMAFFMALTLMGISSPSKINLDSSRESRVLYAPGKSISLLQLLLVIIRAVQARPHPAADPWRPSPFLDRRSWHSGMLLST